MPDLPAGAVESARRDQKAVRVGVDRVDEPVLLVDAPGPESGVRVVSSPFSDYPRYGLWLCKYNVRAGEDIRYLLRDHAPALPDHDYWLLDSSRLYIVRFTETDELLGAEPVDDPREIIEHARWRDAAWQKAVPHAEFVKSVGFSVEHPASA